MLRRQASLLAVAVTLVVPVTLFTFGSPTPASANSGASCGVFVGSYGPSGFTTFKLRRCNPGGRTNKSASGAFSDKSFPQPALITWNASGKTTNMQTLSQSSPGRGSCNSGFAEWDLTWKVTGGTSTYTQIGDVASFKLCMNETNFRNGLRNATRMPVGL